MCPAASLIYIHQQRSCLPTDFAGLIQNGKFHRENFRAACLSCLGKVVGGRQGGAPGRSRLYNCTTDQTGEDVYVSHSQPNCGGPSLRHHMKPPPAADKGRCMWFLLRRPHGSHQALREQLGHGRMDKLFYSEHQ